VGSEYPKPPKTDSLDDEEIEEKGMVQTSPRSDIAWCSASMIDRSLKIHVLAPEISEIFTPNFSLNFHQPRAGTLYVVAATSFRRAPTGHIRTIGGSNTPSPASDNGQTSMEGRGNRFPVNFSALAELER